MIGNHILAAKYIVKNDKNSVKFKGNKLPCSKCGKIDILEPYHKDYIKVRDVIWLCKQCIGEKPKSRNTEITHIGSKEYSNIERKVNGITNLARLKLLPMIDEKCHLCYKPATKVFVYNIKKKQYYYLCKEHDLLLTSLFGLSGYKLKGDAK